MISFLHFICLHILYGYAHPHICVYIWCALCIHIYLYMTYVCIYVYVYMSTCRYSYIPILKHKQKSLQIFKQTKNNDFFFPLGRDLEK